MRLQTAWLSSLFSGIFFVAILRQSPAQESGGKVRGKVSGQPWVSQTVSDTVTIPEQITVSGQEATTDTVIQYLHAGEFITARRLALSMTGDQRNAALLAVAKAERSEGLLSVAFDLVDEISAPRRNAAIAELVAPIRLNLSSGGGSTPTANREHEKNQSLPSGPPETHSQSAANEGTLGAASGGAAIADFDSLIDLIRNTIAPDTWDSVGGPSTLSPYRAGIYVDLDGMVRDVPMDHQEMGDGTNLDAIGATLIRGRRESWQTGPYPPRGFAGDWCNPSPMRVVSLQRLAKGWATRRAAGLRPTAAMEHVAGLSQIRYVVVIENDILFAGPVGGIDPHALPWPRDLQSGAVPLGFDVLAAAAEAVSQRVSFGCSIDPSPLGLANVQRLQDSIVDGTVPLALRAERLAETLGAQTISLFGVRRDSPLAWLMVDADRHMKQLALGVHEMPEGVKNYLDVVSQNVRQSSAAVGAPGTILRMWFAPQMLRVRRAIESLTFEIEGRPMRLVTAKEWADDQGLRSQMGDDPLGEVFAKQFNENYLSIAHRYPQYDRLRGAFAVTAALELVRHQLGPSDFDRLTQWLRAEPAFAFWHLSVPRQCETLAVRHQVMAGQTRHEFYFASGGIEIDPSASRAASVTIYPPLDGLHQKLARPPQARQRWWWDQ